MTQAQTRCLILACGNTLRGDDGVGPWLARWAENKLASDPAIRVIARQQWTPELAEEIAHADSVIFIDCSCDSAPGQVTMMPVVPVVESPLVQTHQAGAAELLAMARDYYDSLPLQAGLLTVGAGSFELSEDFSPSVIAALPEACRLLEETILRLLENH